MSKLLWAFTTNVSSQRWHAFIERKAICGAPLYPVEREATASRPGSHSACKQCGKMVDKFTEIIAHAVPR